MTSAPTRSPSRARTASPVLAARARISGVGQQPVDGAEQLVVGEVVGRQADAVAELVDPLRVVVLVPEQRQHDHRLAEVHGLGRGVVATVGDHQVDLRDDPGLRHDRVADHVVGQPDLVGPGAHAHDHAVLGGAEQVDEPLQQADVGAAERAERQVDQAGTLGPLARSRRASRSRCRSRARWSRSGARSGRAAGRRRSPAPQGRRTGWPPRRCGRSRGEAAAARPAAAPTASNRSHVSWWVRSNSARNGAHCDGSAAG